MPLAIAPSRTPYPGARPRTRRVERIRIHAGACRARFCGRMERGAAQSAQLRRDGVAHPDTLQFRAFWGLPRGPARTHRAGFSLTNFLRRLFNGGESPAENGGWARAVRAPALVGRFGPPAPP